MNANQVIEACKGITIISTGNYEGLPAKSANREVLEAAANIGALIGDVTMTPALLKGWDMMMATTAEKAVKATPSNIDPNFEKIGNDGTVKLLYTAIDENELSAELREVIADYRKANAKAAELAKLANEMAIAEIEASVSPPPGRHTVAGFRFDRVSVAFGRGPAGTKVKSNSGKKLSLAQLKTVVTQIK